MAVSVYLGATECGKSFFVSKNVLPKWDKVVIFDPTETFKGADCTFRAPKDEKDVQRIFRQLVGKEKYKALIVPDGESDLKKLSDYTIILAKALGRALGKAACPEKRVQLVIDEAHQVMSFRTMTKKMEKIVFQGRHSNVDTHLISQVPKSINPDIRLIASLVVCFFLNNATEAPFIRSCFTAEWCKFIEGLPPYYRVEWRQNQNTIIYDQNNKILRKSEKKNSLLTLKG